MQTQPRRTPRLQRGGVEAVGVKVPDGIYEFFDDSTPIDGSSHWTTCYHTNMQKCKAKLSQCCCKAGFVYLRLMSSPMLRAVAAASTGTHGKAHRSPPHGGSSSDLSPPPRLVPLGHGGGAGQHSGQSGRDM